MENKVNNINAVYNRLNNEQKKICEVIFRGITQKQLTEKDASHPTSLKELADMAEVSPEQCQEVVQLFVQENGIIVTTENGMLQLSYDQYMQDWKLLQTWMQTEADLVKEYLKWAKVAEQHQAGKEGLLIDADLKQALAIKDAHKPNSAWGIRYHPHYEQTLSYLDFCRKSEEDEINSRKKLAEHRKGIFRFIFAFLIVIMWGALISSYLNYDTRIQVEKENTALIQMIKKQQLRIDSLMKMPKKPVNED